MPSGVRRRKQNRSSLPKNTRRVKKRQKKVSIKSNVIIAENWDPKLTLTQNYKKLGLRSKLQDPAGGQEKDIKYKRHDEEEEEVIEKPSKLSVNEGRIIRHSDGSVSIEYGEKKKESDEENDEEWTGFETTEVVKQLEEMAKHEIKKPRVQSEREQEWIHRLYEKYGDDYEGMFWDKKLNVYQQSIGDLKNRVKKWKKKQGIA